MFPRILIGLFVASCTTLIGAASPSLASSHPGTSLRPAGRDVERIVAQPIPARDLYSLANQLKLHPPRHISKVIRHHSPNYRVGHTDRFYILSTDKNRYFTIKATIRAEQPHIYLYVQKGVNVSKGDAQSAVQRFERSIYPTDRSFFGSEWRPGVDADPHITCLVADLKSSGVGGYFSAEDEYPHLVNPSSNQREMIYINSVSSVPGDSFFDMTMAHEFQHMIHWHMHPHDNAWLNEGMSMLAEELNGYHPHGEVNSFLPRSNTDLTAWTVSGPTSLAHYGASFLFLAYLYDRFGKGMIRDLEADGKYTDFRVLQDVFRRRHIRQTPTQVFQQWVVANGVRDRSLAHGVYDYSQLPRKVDVQKTTGEPFTYHSQLMPYAAQYVVVDSFKDQKPFRLTFSGVANVPVASTSAGPFWWSNRGDMSNTRLERAVDLRRVRQAMLHFRTWYDIEKDYDYVYVEASKDGGRTWKTLRGTHTTKSSPNGANYGNGYTGSSKGWRSETVDLSAYRGHRIKLRFQYITDDEYTGQGMIIKSISIPQIGLRDNFTGWHQQGFVPIARNGMTNNWAVQLVSYSGKGATVSSMRLQPGNKGSIRTNPAKAGLKKLLVVISTTAPKTTISSPYTLSAKPG